MQGFLELWDNGCFEKKTLSRSSPLQKPLQKGKSPSPLLQTGIRGEKPNLPQHTQEKFSPFKGLSKRGT